MKTDVPLYIYNYYFCLFFSITCKGYERKECICKDEFLNITNIDVILEILDR